MHTTPRRAVLAGGALGAAMAVPAVAKAAASAQEVPLLATYVAGSGYHRAAEVASGLRPGTELVLRRRPGNDYDPRTVEVWTAEGARLGDVPRIHNEALARLMDAGVPARARVRTVVLGQGRPEIGVDVSVTLV